jgi:hypothetical protein
LNRILIVALSLNQILLSNFREKVCKNLKTKAKPKETKITHSNHYFERQVSKQKKKVRIWLRTKKKLVNELSTFKFPFSWALEQNNIFLKKIDS